MALNPNMVAIRTVTVGAGGAASIDFISIPQTYTDLKVVVSARNTTATLDCYINFNGSNTNLSRRVLYGNGSSATSGSGSDGYVIWLSQSTDTANTFGNAEIYIPNYTSSNNKSFTADSVTENNATQAYQFFQAGLWSNASAINRVTLYSGSTFAQYSTATLYGITSAAVGAKATGGIITEDSNYYYHTFLSSGTFTPSQSLTADYLVVAGGGSGGTNLGGGGGAGGMRCTVTATGGGGSLESPLSLTAQAYTVTIGAGGAGATAGNNVGNSGSNSVFSTITSTGGGGGGNRANTTGNGISPSGGGGYGTTGTGASGTASQSYSGGNAFLASGSLGGGGGGGTGQAGNNADSSSAGKGGNGVTSLISGISTIYGGGGGGGADVGYLAGAGGLGGGGAGSVGAGNATAGTANTGGGGGGLGANSVASGAGGSGIVIVRYAK